jgi:hypothetical protein
MAIGDMVKFDWMGKTITGMVVGFDCGLALVLADDDKTYGVEQYQCEFVAE